MSVFFSMISPFFRVVFGHFMPEVVVEKVKQLRVKTVGKWPAANSPASQDSNQGLTAQGIGTIVVCTLTT